MILAQVPPQPLTPVEHTKQLMALEKAALAEGVGTTDCEDMTEHYHCNGAYARVFRLPADHWVTGEVHRFACINIVAKGKLKVKQSDGERILEAGEVYISQPGEKKALYAFEDSVFVNIHATEETEEDKLREIFTVPAEHALEYVAQLRLEDK